MSQGFVVELTVAVKDATLYRIHPVTIPPMAYAVTRTTIMQLTAEASETPNETEATVHMQIAKSHTFLQVMPIIN